MAILDKIFAEVFTNLAQFPFAASKTELQSFTKYLRQTLISFEIAHYEKS